ncbi:hypothetical protein ACN3XK_73775 [Actinomadura welshii]
MNAAAEPGDLARPMRAGLRETTTGGGPEHRAAAGRPPPEFRP